MISENKIFSFKNLPTNFRIYFYILILVLCILFFSHIYGDILITSRHGMLLIDHVLNGDIASFYQNSFSSSGNIYHTSNYYAIYNILIYITFALWNIPLYILENIFQVDVMNNLFCLIWMKSILLFFLYLNIKIFNDILNQFDFSYQDKFLANFSILSSVGVLCPLFVTSQYDIIGLYFILIGVYKYLKSERFRFIFYFSIAICFKSYALLVYIPLVLIQEKRILFVFRDILMGLFLIVITKLPFILSTPNLALSEIDFINRLLNLSSMSINPLIFVLVIIYCASYYYRDINKEEKNKFCVYILANTLLYFIIMGGSTKPYWIILIVPFITIINVNNKKLYKYNLILETLILMSFTVLKMINDPLPYFGNTLKPMVMF